MIGRRARKRLIAAEGMLLVVSVAFLYPLALALMNSLKTMNDILMNMGSLPREYVWSNYETAWNVLNFPRALLNSLLIDVFSVLGVTLISAMCAYQIVRRSGRFNRAMFSLFVASMVIPFHAIMIPLVQVLRELGMINSLHGIVFAYWGLSLAFAIFLYHGFVKALPYEIEEAALIDGASVYSVFFRIVLPLLKPITVTVVIINALWIWNDFLLPMIVLQGPDNRTIQVAINTMFGQYMKRWDVALPGIVMSLAPSVLFFLLMQRQIVEGISSGGIKG